ncbi:hypothetical protein [Granulicella tundricola]|uniref:Uncharacterized protein n=1 Tax=Granulicella tundricola (strain ATCC BAA-1859 / DSM 23138 / MP5ACTX9) TaxID=1198114 RepID=E8X7P7_GRATM|nr:hypothetical protein [Granulicella tundricola]ADW71481.1 hypothetical protein AciX9_4545 [Granulicella tundricola MP5ACTX9]
MPVLRDFIKRLGSLEESICSKCCQVVRTSDEAPTLLKAQAQHVCSEFSLNTVQRGEFAAMK